VSTHYTAVNPRGRETFITTTLPEKELVAKLTALGYTRVERVKPVGIGGAA
jgi:hypothetical protein